jgi:Na+-transporting NADH:ubiquinone oxidoreductase subunit NqrC
MLKIYLLVIVLGLVGGSVYGAYYYYKDSQNRIRILTENTAKLETAKQLQDETINIMIEDREKFAEQVGRREHLQGYAYWQTSET